MKDELIRGLAFGGQVRFVAAYTKETVEEARRIHQTTPLCSAALGRLLTAGALMGALCKNDSDRITLKIDGAGPIRQITVCAEADSSVRGLLYDPSVDLPLKENGHLDVGSGIGPGTLTVIKDIGLKEPYSGTTELVSGEIGEDLTYYFASSEQTPSSVGLGVLVARDLSILHAGGFLIQLLPFATEETICALEEALSRFSSVTDHFLAGESTEQLMQSILGELDLEERRPVRYHCGCTRERVTAALASLGRDELSSMLAEDKPVTLHCDFCNKDYEFSCDEIRALLN